MEFFILLFLFLGGLFNSEMDEIKHHSGKSWAVKFKWFPFSEKFWLGHKNKKRSWLKKYLLSFADDGWHLCKSLMILSFSAAVSVVYVEFRELGWYWHFIVPFILTAFFSAIFTHFYGDSIFEDYGVIEDE